jgi:hypothetical protein
MVSSSSLEAVLIWAQRNRIRSSRRRRYMGEAGHAGYSSIDILPEFAKRFDTLHTVDRLKSRMP